MESLHVIPNVDGAKSRIVTSDTAAADAVRLTDVELIGIPHGTAWRRTAVMLVGRGPDGRAVIVETTLALLEGGLTAIRAACP